MSATAAPPVAKYPDRSATTSAAASSRRTGQLLDVLNPSDGSLLSRVPLSIAADLDAAVRAAAEALPAWSATPIKERVQVFYRYRALLERDFAELAALISEEHGKTRAEAEAEIAKAIELTEFACSLPQIVTGEVLEVSRGVECRTDRHPVGVVASIVPFNFPSMVPHWTIPNAIALGNCMMLKPSELVPLSAGRIAELLAEAGLPAGVFSVVHGGQEVVEAICDHPGHLPPSPSWAPPGWRKLVYRRGTGESQAGARAGRGQESPAGPPRRRPRDDVQPTSWPPCRAVPASAAWRRRSCSRSAETDHIVRRLVEHARTIVPGENLGPVISREAKERIERYIDGGGGGRGHGAAGWPEHRRAGARRRILGRARRSSTTSGPTWRSRRRRSSDRSSRSCAPATSTRRSRSRTPRPTATPPSVFTESGGLARYVTERASAGMVGVNVGVPVPREPFSFGGWNDSKFGVGDITGHGSIEFWTRTKKTTTKWNREAGTNWMS